VLSMSVRNERNRNQRGGKGSMYGSICSQSNKHYFLAEMLRSSLSQMFLACEVRGFFPSTSKLVTLVKTQFGPGYFSTSNHEVVNVHGECTDKSQSILS
jgi:hypothetical protein